ncbi:MAG: hypothetical protein PHD48_09640 [Alphaproteobacteria bacterium]|nr:hypothetical protein [Alphaproteobacteria bacterium]
MKLEAQNIPSGHDEPKHVAERMADAIVEQLKINGECRVVHLRALGFSLDDVARYWPEACKIAENKKRRP